MVASRDQFAAIRSRGRIRPSDPVAVVCDAVELADALGSAERDAQTKSVLARIVASEQLVLSENLRRWRFLVAALVMNVAVTIAVGMVRTSDGLKAAAAPVAPDAAVQTPLAEPASDHLARIQFIERFVELARRLDDQEIATFRDPGFLAFVKAVARINSEARAGLARIDILSLTQGQIEAFQHIAALGPVGVQNFLFVDQQTGARKIALDALFDRLRKFDPDTERGLAAIMMNNAVITQQIRKLPQRCGFQSPAYCR